MAKLYTQFEGRVSKNHIDITDVDTPYVPFGYKDPTDPEFNGTLTDVIQFTVLGTGPTIRESGITTMIGLFQQKVNADLAGYQAIADVYNDPEYTIKSFNIDTETVVDEVQP